MSFCEKIIRFVGCLAYFCISGCHAHHMHSIPKLKECFYYPIGSDEFKHFLTATTEPNVQSRISLMEIMETPFLRDFNSDSSSSSIEGEKKKRPLAHDDLEVRNLVQGSKRMRKMSSSK